MKTLTTLVGLGLTAAAYAQSPTSMPAVPTSQPSPVVRYEEAKGAKVSRITNADFPFTGERVSIYDQPYKIVKNSLREDGELDILLMREGVQAAPSDSDMYTTINFATGETERISDVLLIPTRAMLESGKPATKAPLSTEGKYGVKAQRTSEVKPTGESAFVYQVDQKGISFEIRELELNGTPYFFPMNDNGGKPTAQTATGFYLIPKCSTRATVNDVTGKVTLINDEAIFGFQAVPRSTYEHRAVVLAEKARVDAAAEKARVDAEAEKARQDAIDAENRTGQTTLE
jgi:hypothetical protein